MRHLPLGSKLLIDPRAVRRDIARMYAKYDFVLAPTFRTYLDVLDFINRAGIINRDKKDTSPRRPLTGVRYSDLAIKIRANTR